MAGAASDLPRVADVVARTSPPTVSVTPSACPAARSWTSSTRSLPPASASPSPGTRPPPPPWRGGLGRHRPAGSLVTTFGRGLPNARHGIADASQERVPLVVLSGVVDRAVRSRFTHQVIDHRALSPRSSRRASRSRPKARVRPSPGRSRGRSTVRKGPVHLDLSPASPPRPSRVPPTRSYPRQTRSAAPPSGRTIVPSPESQDRIQSSPRVLIVAGFAAALDAPGAVTTLAEAIGAPVITTYKAKGVIPEDHPLALGAAGLSPAADAILTDAIRAADLVLMLGYDPDRDAHRLARRLRSCPRRGDRANRHRPRHARPRPCASRPRSVPPPRP